MKEFSAPPRLHVLHVPGADPERDRIVVELSAQGDVCLHIDPDRGGVMGNWLRALSCSAVEDVELPWTLIVQDDAQPLRGWQQHLERACAHSPSPFLGLTHFGSYGQRVVDQGVPYGVGEGMIWGGAVAYHRSVVPGLLAWTASLYAETGYTEDDLAVCAYARRIDAIPAMTARAIFGQPVHRSLLSHRGTGRSPVATIETPGPSWASHPRSVKTPSSEWSRSMSKIVHFEPSA